MSSAPIVPSSVSGNPLEVEIAGIRFKNPVLPASGTFGYGLEFLPFFDLSRLGGFCTKGLSPKPLKGNPPPRIGDDAPAA